MKFVCLSEEDGRTHFGCTRKARIRLLKVWEKALIVKLLGRNTGVAFMKKKIEMLWARSGKINVTDVGNGFYVVQFSNTDDLLFALNGGPWVILGHYLSLRRWEPAFYPHAASVMKIAAWVRLPDIPLEFYNEAFFRRIGNWLGKLLKIDRTTNEHARGCFARICVELDLAQCLKGEYVLNGATNQIDYEGLGLICFQCGRYGHSKECCPESSVDGNDGQQNSEGKKDELSSRKMAWVLGWWCSVNVVQEFKTKR
ncbi:uncharacterized protein LOC133292949 [Gastrolobium bilobum]|uniref:uncharacterized protein LOC133292949 n=1 Tax=Gastrolobium bilobum TaxID=150636 RepID=UPI002AAFBBF4|nr:uncharacterized protein LOC133292949 [Gastrolobium bilobum]